MTNTIFPFLKFTTELGEHFADGKLPSLDTNVWVKDKLTEEKSLPTSWMQVLRERSGKVSILLNHHDRSMRGV